MPSLLWPSILLITGAVSSAYASSPRHERAPDICLTFKLIWRGSLEDTRRIATKPVPQSYRRLLASDRCQNLSEAGLIDWHLAFGDEGSTTQALRFLAATELKGLPSVQEFETSLPHAWRQAEAAAKRHPIDLHAFGPEYTRQMDVLRGDRAIKRLQTLVTAYRSFTLLAELYLRAAEFFRSQALLDQASAYFEPIEKAGAAFYAGQRFATAEGTPLWDAAGLEPGGVDILHDLEMHYALARYRISRSPADLAAATAVVKKTTMP